MRLLADVRAVHVCGCTVEWCIQVVSYVDVCVCGVCIVQRCIQLVSCAKKPVMLIGSQATLPPCPVEKLQTVVEV